MKKVTDIVWELAEPVVKENGCELWDVEYVREAGQWYLRLYLDKEGGVDILDCEAVSRRVSDLLDEADPIESSYMFEVSSAGAERQLKRPSDFQRFLGQPVLVKTYKNRDGRKEFAGTLAGCLARFAIHYISGVTVYKILAPTEFLNWTFSSPALYSLVYNGSYMLPNTIITLLISVVLYVPLKRFILGLDLK